MSDDWKGYNGLTNLGFNHHVVVHKYNFVEPDTIEVP
jgi:hypothetical protein